MRNIVSILEFDLGLHLIRIHKLDKDSCSSSSWINKISYATQLYKTNKEMESLINPNIEHILRCIISINSVSITGAHITLGFTSLQDQVNFIQDSNFEKAR